MYTHGKRSKRVEDPEIYMFSITFDGVDLRFATSFLLTISVKCRIFTYFSFFVAFYLLKCQHAQIANFGSLHVSFGKFVFDLVQVAFDTYLTKASPR